MVIVMEEIRFHLCFFHSFWKAVERKKLYQSKGKFAGSLGICDGIGWQCLSLHAQNILVYNLFQTIFLLSCLHGWWSRGAVNTPTNKHSLPLAHLLEKVSVAVFAHVQKPVDIKVFHKFQTSFSFQPEVWAFLLRIDACEPQPWKV